MRKWPLKFTWCGVHSAPISWPYLDEIRSFYKVSLDLITDELTLSYATEWLQLNHFVILHTLLSIISWGLGLHPDRCVHSRLDTFTLNVIYQLLGTASSTGCQTSRRYPYQRFIPCCHVSSVIHYAHPLPRNSHVYQIHLLKKTARKPGNYGFLHTPIGKTWYVYKMIHPSIWYIKGIFDIYLWVRVCACPSQSNFTYNVSQILNPLRACKSSWKVDGNTCDITQMGYLST